MGSIKSSIAESIRDSLPSAVSQDSPTSLAAQRKQAILNGTRADFTVADNPEAKVEPTGGPLSLMSEVQDNKTRIENAAMIAGVDPDLVKSIVYLETTHGAYDKVFSPLDLNNSIRPMNLQTKYWSGLGYSRQDLKDPGKNIAAGVDLLRRIQGNMPKASIAQVATVYHSLGAKKVSDYGATVQSVYKNKPWDKSWWDNLWGK